MSGGKYFRKQLTTIPAGRAKGRQEIMMIDGSTSLLIEAAQDLEAMRARVETNMAILQVLRESPGG